MDGALRNNKRYDSQITWRDKYIVEYALHVQGFTTFKCPD